MPIFKAPNSDTCIADEAPEGWIKITKGEFDAICDSRRVQTDPTIAVNAKLKALREVREAILNRLAGIALVAQLTGDTTTVNGFLVARAALLDITTGCPTDPSQVDGFIQAKYGAIVAALPPALLKAFAGVDA
jgi:hypothetical protein